jgi:hypothetical protein
MSGRRLDVTATQAVSSMMAALTGAIAASRLGIAGTIVGAAFMSLASTLGAAVYKHYLARSNERLRHRLHRDPAAAAGPGRPARPDDQAGTRADAASGRDGTAAAAVAADIAAAVAGGRTTVAHASGGYPAAGDTRASSGDGGTAGRWGHAAGGRDGAGAERDRAADRRGQPRRRWLILAGAVLGVFVVAMGAVTAVEAIAGKPLESLIWHRAGSGTTIGSVVSHPARHPATVPGTGPAQSPPAQPSSTSPGSVSPTPAATPTPSQSAAPGPGASTPPGTGTSPGPGTSPDPATSPDTGTPPVPGTSGPTPAAGP